MINYMKRYFLLILLTVFLAACGTSVRSNDYSDFSTSELQKYIQVNDTFNIARSSLDDFCKHENISEYNYSNWDKYVARSKENDSIITKYSTYVNDTIYTLVEKDKNNLIIIKRRFIKK